MPERVYAQPGRSVLSMKIGFLSAVFLFVSGIGYASSFITMILFYPGTTWSGMESFAADYRTGWGTVLLFMQLMAFLQPIAFAVLISSVYDLADPDKKIWARIGLLFAAAFMAVSTINYIIQMTVVRQSVLAGQLEGIASLVQLNPASPMFALVILSWGLFQGLASLAIAPIFGGGKLENAIRWLLAIYGLNGLVGSIGCMLGNMGVMIAFLAIINIVQPFMVVALGILFYRMVRSKDKNKLVD
jgi:hypothetical protein